MNAAGGFIAGSIVAKLLLDKTGWNAAVAGIRADKGSLLSITKGVGAGFVRLGQIATVAGIAAGAALAVMVKKTAEAGDALWDMSQRTGVSVETLSGLKLAAEKSGTSLEGVALGLRFLGRSAAGASDDVKTSKRAFADLGVSVEDVNGKIRPMQDLLVGVADKFATMEAGADKTALAIKLFGRSGTDLIPMLNLGAAGLREQIVLADKLGITFTAKTAMAADKLMDSLVEIRSAFTGMRNDIANAIIPVFNEFAAHVVDALVFLRGKIAEFTESGQLRDWAIGTAKVFLGAFKIIVRGFEILAMAIPSLSAGISKTLAATQDAVAAVAKTIGSLVGGLSGVAPAAVAGFKVMAAEAKAAAADLRKAADEQIDKASEIAVPFETLIRALDMISVGFGKTVEPAKRAVKEIKTAFDSLELKNKLQLTFKSDVAEKIADITRALKIFKEQLTPEVERKLRDELEALGEKFGFLKTALNITFTSDVQKRIEDIQKAVAEFQDRMNPESARALAEELRHLADDTDYLRAELGLTFTDDDRRRIDDIRLALEKYKGQLKPETERKLREELRLLGTAFGFLKTSLNLVFKSDIEQEIADIELALNEFGEAAKDAGMKLPDKEIQRLMDRLRELRAMLKDTTPLQQFGANMERVLGKIQEAVQLVSAAVSGYVDQARTNAEISVENEYKTRLAYINKNVTDEEARQKAVTALEAEYQIKKTEAARKGAALSKAVALMEAIVNTASGVARAFKDFPFPLSAIIAGIVGALGAVQVGLITTQPVPLAEGASFEKPTLLVGEKGPEHTLRETKLVQIVHKAMELPQFNAAPAMAMARTGGGGAVVNLHLNGPLVATSGLSRRDLEAAGEELRRIVDGQLRRVGRGR